MEQKIITALFCGGDSSEREVSVKSALNVLNFIDREKITPYLVFIQGTDWFVIPVCAGRHLTVDQVFAHACAPVVNKTDFSFELEGEHIAFSNALIMIHGTPGENGLLQGYLEMMHVPFNTCSSFVSAITFDKHSCKRFLDYAGVKMAKDVFIRKDGAYSVRDIIRRIGLPMFVKPTVGGSSFGVTKVKSCGVADSSGMEEDMRRVEEALNHAFTECDMVLCEQAIKGRELTNGIFKIDGEIHKLPVTEIVTDREFFDYQAKYLGESQEICPAPITPALASKVQALSERIYNYMGCSGVVRMDYIMDEHEDLYFLEVNTVPGMTEMSLIPRQLEVAGIPLQDFITRLITDKSR